MKLAIMQPYLFPYSGYFQLIHAIDQFIFYDDVAFIKQGWIARNQILLNGEAHIFSTPLENASSFTVISETKLHPKKFKIWKGKFLKTLQQSYSKAPYYIPTVELIQKTMESETKSVSALAINSVKNVIDYLGMKKRFSVSSTAGFAKSLSGKDRVLAICKKENADTYINLPGGESLYEKSFFEEAGIKLQFIQTGDIRYAQFKEPFVPHLSIIDLLMFNSKEQVLTFISDYTLK